MTTSARVERDMSGIAVAERPLPIPTLRGKPRGRWTVGRISRIGQLISLGLLGIGLHQSGIVPTTIDALSEFLRAREGNVVARMARDSRPLGPQAGEAVNWWMELPAERIRDLAQLPEINQIGERFVSTVSPALQEKAQQAGYKLIYQGDLEDAVGRTVITKGRRPDQQDWSLEDLGFGRAGLEVRGTFKAWVPDPEDPNQKENVYALLQNPITNQEYLVAVQLFPYDPNRLDIRPTWFVVGNLDYGPEYVREKSALTGLVVTNKQTGATSEFIINPDLVPDPQDPPSVKSKKITDSPTFNELLREKGLQLTNIVKPGDYVKAIMQVTGVDMQTGKNTYKKDGHGVNRSLGITVRRFGGFSQWQSEVQ